MNGKTLDALLGDPIEGLWGGGERDSLGHGEPKSMPKRE